MFRAALTLFVSCALSLNIAPQPHVEQSTITVNGLSRPFSFQYPSGTSPADGWPVVFGFHGWGGTGWMQALSDGMRQFGARTAVVVHPEGWPLAGDEPRSWHGAGSAGKNADDGVDSDICDPQTVLRKDDWKCYKSCEHRGYCTQTGGGVNRCRWSHCEDDVAFILAILESLGAKFKLDSKRIFATGDSNGALFVYELAMDPRSNVVFSAIAPVSGLPHNGFNKAPSKHMRCLNFEGSADTYVWSWPNVAGDRTKSYGIDYGWYYSNLQNTTNLWLLTKGLSGGTAELSSRFAEGLNCSGWSQDGLVEHSELANCIYKGTHSSPPQSARQLIWKFFGLETA